MLNMSDLLCPLKKFNINIFSFNLEARPLRSLNYIIEFHGFVHVKLFRTLGKPQKSSFLTGRATKRRRGGLMGVPLWNKITFFNVRKKVPIGH